MTYIIWFTRYHVTWLTMHTFEYASCICLTPMQLFMSSCNCCCLRSISDIYIDYLYLISISILNLYIAYIWYAYTYLWMLWKDEHRMCQWTDTHIVYIYIYIYVYIYICVCVCACVRMCTDAHTQTHVLYVYCMHIYIYIYIHKTYIYIHICTHTCTSTLVFAQLHVNKENTSGQNWRVYGQGLSTSRSICERGSGVDAASGKEIADLRDRSKFWHVSMRNYEIYLI